MWRPLAYTVIFLVVVDVILFGLFCVYDLGHVLWIAGSGFVHDGY